MNCPTNEMLHELVLNELEADERARVIEHVKSCETCRETLRELVTTYAVLATASAEEACPSGQEMADYASHAASAETQARVASHVARCRSCSFLISLFEASEEEREKLSRREYHLFRMAQIEKNAADVTQRALERLLPDYPGLFEQVWPQAEAFFESLGEDESFECEWPSLEERGQLVGALGFATSLPPSTRAAAVIAMTALAATAETALGKLEKDPGVLRQRVGHLARRFGAGAELAGRLSELLPNAML